MRTAAIIPLHNGEAFIAQTLQNVVDATAFERIVVVLDHCTDGSEEVARSFGEQVEVLHSPQRGVSTARNTGAHHVQDCELIHFVDGDDLLRPGAAQVLQAALLNNPEAVAAYGNYDRIDETGAPYGTVRARGDQARPSGDILDLLLRENFIATNSILIRRDAFVKSGGFDPSLSHGEDWHVWTKLACLGPIIHVPMIIFDYRLRAGSATYSGNHDVQKYMAAVDAIYGDDLIRSAVAAPRLAALHKEARGHVFAYLAQQCVRAGDYGRALRWIGRSFISSPIRGPRRLATLVKVAQAARA